MGAPTNAQCARGEGIKLQDRTGRWAFARVPPDGDLLAIGAQDREAWLDPDQIVDLYNFLGEYLEKQGRFE